MKTLFISAVLLASTTSFASGFVCSGSQYNVKMYNQVQPQMGTKNPAVLVVSHVQAGTLAVLNGTEINKANKGQSFVYGGQTNAKPNGRFVYVELEVAKQAIAQGPNAGQHVAHLTVNADNRNYSATVLCAPYLKN